VAITPLALLSLKNIYTETHQDNSNEFTYSRFLVPYLSNYTGWAIFLDGDMVLVDDISKLWNLADDRYAAMVVKHNYKTKSTSKYLGNVNEDYPCKNWSSVVLWNCGHPKNRILTPELVSTSTGSFLHQFKWLDHNCDIGELPVEWNWLPDEYGVNQNAKLVHYTLGTPCFDDYSNTAMAELWHIERSKL
jgi:lipopolysaccharide biosynthesis glycosyltransferase